MKDKKPIDAFKKKVSNRPKSTINNKIIKKQDLPNHTNVGNWKSVKFF